MIAAMKLTWLLRRVEPRYYIALLHFHTDQANSKQREKRVESGDDGIVVSGVQKKRGWETGGGEKHFMHEVRTDPL
jgi:hypothetical protein